MKCQVDAIQWGGGSSRKFPRSQQKPMRFSGGGGSSRNFPRSQQKPTRFSGGGSSRNVSLIGPFYVVRLSQIGHCMFTISSRCGFSLHFVHMRNGFIATCT